MSDHYVRGEMDITTQKSTWEGFMKVSLWASFIIVLVLGYATLTLTAIGMNWAVALGLMAIVGIAGGLFMSMGGAWIVTVVGLVILAVFLQIIIALANMAM